MSGYEAYQAGGAPPGNCFAGGAGTGGFVAWEESFGWSGEKGTGRSTAMEDWALLLGVEDGRVEGGWGDETRVGEGGEEMRWLFARSMC